MAVETRRFDAAEYLGDDQEIAEYLEEALSVATEESDPGFMAHALETVERARNVADLPAGVTRPQTILRNVKL
jgi:probable addiction module antidote protein